MSSFRAVVVTGSKVIVDGERRRRFRRKTRSRQRARRRRANDPEVHRPHLPLRL